MKNLSLMGVTIFSRLGGLFLLFVLLARVLSLNDFGIFVVAYSLATILSLFVDFGFSQSLLKDIGGDKASAARYVTEGLALKIVLALLMVFGAIAVSYVKFDSADARLSFFILFLSCLAVSFAEFYGTALRAIGKYTEEAVAQFAYTLLMLIVAVVIGYFFSSVVAVSCALLVSRLLLLLAMKHVLERTLDLLRLNFSKGHMLETARRTLAYAMDQGVSNFLVNIDVVLVSAMLGTTAAAIYQAGQKLVQGYSATALVISNVYLPKLAQSTADVRVFKMHAIRAGMQMVLLGVGGSLVLLFFSVEIVSVVYGGKFETLVSLMPFFALLILMRFSSGALGLFLTALGRQRLRLVANAVCLFVVVSSAIPLLSMMGLKGIVVSQLLAVFVLLGIYAVTLYVFWKKEL